MEMRRLGSPHGRSRLLLSLYWLACGYGLRAGRALGWLTLVTALAAGAVCWTIVARPARQPAIQRASVPHVTMPHVTVPRPSVPHVTALHVPVLHITVRRADVPRGTVQRAGGAVARADAR